MQHARQRPQQSSLAQSGHALQQHMAAGQQTDDYAVNDVLLANNDFADFGANLVETGDGLWKGDGLSHMSIVWQPIRRYRVNTMWVGAMPARWQCSRYKEP